MQKKCKLYRTLGDKSCEFKNPTLISNSLRRRPLDGVHSEIKQDWQISALYHRTYSMYPGPRVERIRTRVSISYGPKKESFGCALSFFSMLHLLKGMGCNGRGRELPLLPRTSICSKRTSINWRCLHKRSFYVPRSHHICGIVKFLIIHKMLCIPYSVTNQPWPKNSMEWTNINSIFCCIYTIIILQKLTSVQENYEFSKWYIISRRIAEASWYQSCLRLLHLVRTKSPERNNQTVKGAEFL
jgi:hypothetical protein